MRERGQRWPPNRPLTFKPRNEDRITSLREFDVDNGDTIVAIFQGSRGARSDLDIIVKYRQRGTRSLRTPQHLHWAIDLLIKKQHRQSLTNRFVEFLIRSYDRAEAFQSVEDRLVRPFTFLVNQREIEGFQELNAFGEYSVEFTWHILELMAAAEKTSNPDAFMFRGVLTAILEDRGIFRIVSASSYRG